MQASSSASELDALEDSVVPPYLSRPKAYTFEKQRRVIDNLMAPLTKTRKFTTIGNSRAVTPAPSVVDGGEPGSVPATPAVVPATPAVVSKWKVQDVDYNAWRHNTIDARYRSTHFYISG